MKIVINDSKTIEVIEKSLTVKDGKLYNLVDKCFEGLEGDKITFLALNDKGDSFWVTGTVEAYTCHRRIKLKDVKGLYACADVYKKTIVHKSRITETDCKEQPKTLIEEEWEMALS